MKLLLLLLVNLILTQLDEIVNTTEKGRLPQFFWKLKMTFNWNGRKPQFFKMEDDLIVLKMEDDFSFLNIEDDLFLEWK